MDVKPLVSVIMNCHNGDRFLKEAIDSVYSQIYQNWEIIFWDNVSTDKSASIVALYDHKVKYFLADEKTSLGEARNLALNKAIGKYICFLDCDDIYLPNKLEKQVNMMEESNYPLAYGSALIIDENNNKIKKFTAKNKSGFNFNNLLNYYEINMQSVILRKTYLDDKNLNFQTNFQYNPDYNLFMQICAENEIGVEKECIVKYRVLDNSLSSTTLNLVGPEIRLTLDSLLTSYPYIEKKFKKELNQAYGKSLYYDSIAAIHEKDFKRAQILLKKLISTTPVSVLKFMYMGLFLILFLPLPSKIVLKFLNRNV
ncbi:MAG: hypothetical protein CMG57_08235 [Candidatus Marinimicrobia bacterium]|nr:hypothetical protein [Candidatus Neomarinimicrobiota bacterium]|tara:strand:- start:2358 stop:3293 length:936 start_codon:yes stop_codon:yes gene_type:complete